MQQNDLFNGKFPKKQDTSEKLKAKQYSAAALLCTLAAILMTVVSRIWGNVMLGSSQDEVPLSFLLYCVRNLVLIFGGIDLASAVYHFMLWDRSGRPSMEDDNDSLFSDWKGGERSPVKVSLILMAGIMVLALLIAAQG